MKALHTAAEMIHSEALAAARRAIRAGDLVKAQHWMKLAHLHWLNGLQARAEYDRTRDEDLERHRRRIAARTKAKAAKAQKV